MFEISNRSAVLENLDAEMDINRVWETIRENIKISAKESLGYYELKKHKLWFEIKKLKKWPRPNKGL
jgi:predicted transcriptional regulator